MGLNDSVYVCVYDEKFVYTGCRYPVQGHAIGVYLGGLEYPLVKRHFATGVNAPKIDDLPMYVTIGGVPYELGLLGSTHDKDGVLYYNAVVDGDKIRAKFPLEKAEDTVRMLRALLSNGRTYGAVHDDKMVVMVVPPGTIIDNLPYEDGSAAVSDKFCPMKGNAIKLGSTSNNYSIFQGLDWDVIRPDVEKCAESFAFDLEWNDQTHTTHRKNPDLSSSVVLSRIKGKDDDDSFKARFLRANPALAKYIWFSNGASAEGARLCLSQSFSPYIRAEDFLAIAYHTWTVPEGYWIVYRHPVISDGSVRAIHCEPGVELPTDIIGGIVGTLTGFHPSGQWFTAKFAGVIRSLPEGIDMILCQDDIKIGKRLGPITITVDAVLTILQRYTRAACMGVPVEEGKKMNLDYDGDLINRIDANLIMLIWGNVLEHQDLSSNFKLTEKSDTPWTQRDALRVELNAMGGSMGWATNLRSWWFSVSTQGRQGMIKHIYEDIVALADIMHLDGEVTPTAFGIEGVLQYLVQYMIDSQKNLKCDTSIVYGVMATLQSHFSVVTVKSAGYTSANRSMHEGVAFVTSFPKFLYEATEDELFLIENDPKYRKQWQYKMLIPGACDGVPAQCFAINREYTKQVFDITVRNPDPMGSRTFSNWVPMPTNLDGMHAIQLCDLYLNHFNNFERARAKGDVNPYDSEDVNMYRNQWQDECINFANAFFDGDRKRAAHAFWRAICDDGGYKLSGACFIGFPEECMEIVTSYATTLKAHRCVLVGVQHSMAVLPEKLSGTCEIVNGGGRVWMAPLEDIPGMHERFFGHMAEVTLREGREGYSWPTVGKFSYKLNMRQSGTAYDATFEPLI